MIGLMLAMLAPAWAQDNTPDPDDEAEIVLVWPDKFARWRDTRWLVTVEVVIPTGMSFIAQNNNAFTSYAWQAKAVMACDEDYKLSGKKIEVLCKIEQIGLQATSTRHYKKEKDRQLVQRILDELDTKLTGAAAQLQVNARGSVTNIDIEGEKLSKRNQRERLQVETLRLLLARMLYPFHMKLPKSGVQEGNWPEFDSELMTMPSMNGVRGQSTIVHWMNFYKGYLLVQDIGTGSVAITAPEKVQEDFGGGGGSAAADPDAAASVFGGGDAPPADLLYKLHMDGVSIYNIDNGVMEERVWSVSGKPSAATTNSLGFWYSGRIQLLGESDKPDVGPTRQISYPGIEIEGLPVWLPADPEIAKDLKNFAPKYKIKVPKAKSK